MGAAWDPHCPAGCSSFPSSQLHSCFSLPSCGTGLALPTARPPWPSHVERLCSPTRSPSWPTWKVKATSYSISGHSLALTTLTLDVMGRKSQLGDSRVVPAGMKKVLGHRKGQAALSRRMTLVRDRAMVEAQRKIKQAEKTLGNSLSISTTARRKAGEAEQVSGENAKVQVEGCGVQGAHASCMSPGDCPHLCPFAEGTGCAAGGQADPQACQPACHTCQ